MAHNCVQLKIAVDPLALYRCRDENALAFVDDLIFAVDRTRRQEQARADAEANKKR